MTRLFRALLPFLVAASVALPAAAQGLRALAPGDDAPPLRGRLLPEGKPTTFDWADDRVTLINFWATWCTYCKDQMPMLQAVWDMHRERGLRILGVYDQDVEFEDIRGYYEPLGVKYPIVRAHGRTNVDWRGIHALPTSFLIGADGRILRRYIGATREQTLGMIADIEAVLDGRQMGKLVIPEDPAYSAPPETAAEAAEREKEVETWRKGDGS